jgi:hypothetical protein
MIAVGLLVGLWLFIPAAPGAAQIYKWVDASGTVHFADSPPPPAGTGAGTVEVLPESEHRPPPADTSNKSRDDAGPEEAAAPSEEEPTDDAWRDEASEPRGEDVQPDIIIESGPDPAVGYRANSPRNRPGQPIRQPGSRPGRRR